MSGAGALALPVARPGIYPPEAYRTVMRFKLGSSRIELLFDQMVSIHFEVIREGGEIRVAQVEGDRIVPISIDQFNAHMQRAIRQAHVATSNFAVGADIKVGHGLDPESVGGAAWPITRHLTMTAAR